MLHLISGKIAAGKSTLANKLALMPKTLLISEDHWTSNLFGPELRTLEDYARLSARLRGAMGPHIVAILKQGLSVVLDFPANTVQQRLWMRGLITEAGVPHEMHVLDLPDEVCLTRLRARNASGRHPFQVSEADFAAFSERYVLPSQDEGFNIILRSA